MFFESQEGNLKMQRKVKVQEEMEDREASIARAKLQASLAEGISWVMAEDAIEEATEVRNCFPLKCYCYCFET